MYFEKQHTIIGSSYADSDTYQYIYSVRAQLARRRGGSTIQSANAITIGFVFVVVV
jgi:hypothetical protein